MLTRRVATPFGPNAEAALGGGRETSSPTLAFVCNHQTLEASDRPSPVQTCQPREWHGQRRKWTNSSAGRREREHARKRSSPNSLSPRFRSNTTVSVPCSKTTSNAEVDALERPSGSNAIRLHRPARTRLEYSHNPRVRVCFHAPLRRPVEEIVRSENSRELKAAAEVVEARWPLSGRESTRCRE